MGKVDNEVYGKIRNMYVSEGRSQRYIARTLGISRGTVKKYCTGRIIPEEAVKRSVVKDEKRTAIEKIITAMYEENKDSHKKQRLNARIVWEKLVDSGYDVADSTVRKYIREMRMERPDAFVPLDFEPGEMMEVDWGEAYVMLNGVKTKVSLFCAVLPYSFAIHCSVFNDKVNTCFESGLVNALEYFGGVSKHVLFDNLKSAVLSGTGANAVKQENFKKIEAHYAFEARFANGNSGWEKGACENLVSIMRSIAFVPVPVVANFKELQDHVTRKCVRYCESHRIKNRPRNIKDMWAEERSCLMPLPVTRWDPCKEIRVKVHTDLTVRVGGVRYSVPAEHVQTWLTAKVSPFHVHLYKDGEPVWRHEKGAHSGDHRYVPEHYLDILMMKKRAIPNALPLKKGVMPPEMVEFQRLCKSPDKNMHLVNILLLARKTNPDDLAEAVKRANATGFPSYDKVCLYLGLRSDGLRNASVEDGVKVDPVDFGVFDRLIEGGGGYE